MVGSGRAPRWVAGGLAALLLAAGCTGRAAPEEPAGAVATTAAVTGQGLETRWLQDSDGNEVPDFVEQELGRDPLADDCAPVPCPSAVEGTVRVPGDAPLDTVVVLDASAAAGPVGPGQTDPPRLALTQYAALASPDRRLGLVVAGQAVAGGASCAAPEVRADLGAFSPDSAEAALGQVAAGTGAALAAALTAAGDLHAAAPDTGAAAHVLVLAGGGDVCGGDVGAAAAALAAAGTTVDVVGVGVAPGGPEEDVLRAAARSTGGAYARVGGGEELLAWTLDRILAEQRLLLEASLCRAEQAGEAADCDEQLARAARDRVQQERARSEGDASRVAALDALDQAIADHAAGSAQARSVLPGLPGTGERRSSAAPGARTVARRGALGPWRCTAMRV